jgi:hypothetical protein
MIFGCLRAIESRPEAATDSNGDHGNQSKDQQQKISSKRSTAKINSNHRKRTEKARKENGKIKAP